MLLQMNSNISVTKQTHKQTNKEKYIHKIELFVPYNGHQNCLDKSLPLLPLLLLFLVVIYSLLLIYLLFSV